MSRWCSNQLSYAPEVCSKDASISFVETTKEQRGTIMEIAGKTFIVTGAASGLGEGTARRLAACGGKVVVADLQVDKGQQVAKEIGGVFVKTDVSQEADAQQAVAEALKLGKLMGL